MKYFSIIILAVVVLSSCTATKTSFHNSFSPVLGDVKIIYQATYKFDEEKARRQPNESEKPKVVEIEEEIVEEEATYIEVEAEAEIEEIEEVEETEIEPVAEVEDIKPKQPKKEDEIDRIARQQMEQRQREQLKRIRTTAKRDKKAAIKKRVQEDFEKYEKVLSLSDSTVYFHNKAGNIYKTYFYCPYATDGMTKGLGKCHENNIYFDKKGKLLSFQSISFYKKEADTINQIVQTYSDETNFPLLLERKKPNGEFVGRLEFIYDEKNLVKQQIMNDVDRYSDEKKMRKTIITFERNQQGWIKKMTVVDEEEIDKPNIYEYEFSFFDEKGNWTKMTMYNPYFDYPEVIYRKFVYR